MTKIYLVEAYSCRVPGRHLSAHATLASANASAAESVNLLLAGTTPRTATAANWNSVLEDAERAVAAVDGEPYDPDHPQVGEVEITELELRS
jgi:hypothetical protein